ncbi:activated RNA polymerase II transcriptional coactivator p15-like isoform X2 [Mya arenaria]|uniref:activated RNA polymerase II transcriptional coactivator p15-like isoform X2 n=1 Tax=Mya arenaria TaxID=6604 RepID=UPI0022E03C92|nr:activated RNA polymerase II transcriptional coactivator p15-like isoform X2 [Mya arenaria]
MYAGASIEVVMPKSKEFVSSSDESSSDIEEPKKKKAKQEKKEKEPKKKAEEPPKKKAASAAKGPNGDYSFQIANKRFVTVSEFRGKVMVGIREFYDADGELRPGKKGISLPLDQWRQLKNQMDDIEQAISDLS